MTDITARRMLGSAHLAELYRGRAGSCNISSNRGVNGNGVNGLRVKRSAPGRYSLDKNEESFQKALLTKAGYVENHLMTRLVHGTAEADGPLLAPEVVLSVSRDSPCAGNSNLSKRLDGSWNRN